MSEHYKTRWYDVFLHDYWGENITSVRSCKSYRPLTTLSLRLTAQYVSATQNTNNIKNSPQSFHFGNIVLNSVVSSLFTYLCGFYIYNAEKNRQKIVKTLLTAVVFSTHPVHCDTVSNIANRAEILSAIFYILSLVVYIENCNCNSNSNSKKKYIMHMFLSNVFAICSLLCKEQGITILGVCICYDVLMLNATKKSFKNKSKNVINRLLYVHQIKNLRITTFSSGLRVNIFCYFTYFRYMFFITAVIIILRYRLSAGTTVKWAKIDNPVSFHTNVYIKYMNYFYYHSRQGWFLLGGLVLPKYGGALYSIDWSGSSVRFLFYFVLFYFVNMGDRNF